MSVTHGQVVERRFSSSNAFDWVLRRLMLYVLAAAVSMAIFLAWAAFYTYVWPGRPQQLPELEKIERSLPEPAPKLESAPPAKSPELRQPTRAESPIAATQPAPSSPQIDQSERSVVNIVR